MECNILVILLLDSIVAISSSMAGGLQSYYQNRGKVACNYNDPHTVGAPESPANTFILYQVNAWTAFLSDDKVYSSVQ